MHKLFYFLFTSLAITEITGCSTANDFYNENNKDIFACDKQPVQHREACQKQLENAPSYEDYQKQRRQLLD